MRIAIAMLTGVLLASLAHAAQSSIVGDWYEEAVYGGSRTISVLHIKADGSFSAVYRTCLKHGELDNTDSGRWTEQNGKIRMMTDMANGVMSFAIDDYETKSNDGHIWVYQGVAGEGFAKYGPVTFRDVRVTADSKVPSCDVVS